MLKAIDKGLWHGRIDPEDGNAGLRWHQQVQFTIPDKPGVALLGLASDTGIARNQGRIGAAAGPIALRQALASLAWHSNTPLYDHGDIVADEDLDSAQLAYADAAYRLLQQQQLVIGIGGGHEIGWASYLGYRRWLDGNKTPQRLGIINIDAHFDLRKPSPLPSSGTPFYQAAMHSYENQHAFRYCCLGIALSANTQALFNRASELQVSYLLDYNCELVRTETLLQKFIADLDAVYLSVCLDALPPSVAPGVSAPAALGVNLHYVLGVVRMIGQICRQHKTLWQIADIAELSPRHDIDNRTARAAARIVTEVIASHSNLETADGFA